MDQYEQNSKDLKEILDNEKRKKDGIDLLFKSINVIDGIVFNLEGDSIVKNKPELWDLYGKHIYKAMNDLRSAIYDII